MSMENGTAPLSDEEIRAAAQGAVDVVKHDATDAEIAEAIAQIAAERDGQDRSGD